MLQVKYCIVLYCIEDNTLFMKQEAKLVSCTYGLVKSTVDYILARQVSKSKV